MRIWPTTSSSLILPTIEAASAASASPPFTSEAQKSAWDGEAEAKLAEARTAAKASVPPRGARPRAPGLGLWRGRGVGFSLHLVDILRRGMSRDRPVRGGGDQLAEAAGAHVSGREQPRLARRHAIVGKDVARLILLGPGREGALGDRADENEDRVECLFMGSSALCLVEKHRLHFLGPPDLLDSCIEADFDIGIGERTLGQGGLRPEAVPAVDDHYLVG